MERAARLLGLCGGAAGVGFAYLAVYLEGPATGLGAKGPGWLLVLSFIAFLLAVAGGWIGATLSSRSRWSAVALFVIGALGFVCLAVFWIVPGVLLFASACFSLATRKKVDSQAPV